MVASEEMFMYSAALRIQVSLLIQAGHIIFKWKTSIHQLICADNWSKFFIIIIIINHAGDYDIPPVTFCVISNNNLLMSR